MINSPDRSNCSRNWPTTTSNSNDSPALRYLSAIHLRRTSPRSLLQPPERPWRPASEIGSALAMRQCITYVRCSKATSDYGSSSSDFPRALPGCSSHRPPMGPASGSTPAIRASVSGGRSPTSTRISSPSDTKTEVTVLHGYQRVPTAERFADAFAENFLLPASGVKRRFHEIRQSRREGVTPADLLHLADLFQVSLEALVRRLENLDLVRPHTWDRLVKQGFRVGEARKMLELAALPPDEELLPLRYRYLAVEAYLEGRISEGQFARLLRTDRTTARKLAQQLSHRIGMDESGTISEVEIGHLDVADAANG